MLRALIGLLLAANLGYFAWTQGWLDGVVGWRSIGDREPERLQRQVRPEAIRLLQNPGAAASPAPSTAVSGATPPSCFEAGPFTDAEVAAAQAAAQVALPSGSWTTQRTERAASWAVYMGRYAEREAMTKKEDELKRRNLPYEELSDVPALAPGLVLGRFDARPAAAQALDRLTQQGVRTARVVELAPAAGRSVLRVANADAALAARLTAIRVDALGRGFAPCERVPGN